MTPTDLIQAQLDAYNAQQLDAYCALFAPDCLIADLNGAVSERGVDAIRARYAKMFAEFPENHVRVVSRSAIGNVVVDHEAISRGPNGPTFECLAIYTVRDGSIARVDFVRA